MAKEPQGTGSFCGRTRREFLRTMGGGFTSLAMAGLLEKDGFLGKQAFAADGVTPYENPLAPKPPHFAPKAKSVIFLFMYGGPSHVDTFDHKPDLYKYDGQTIKVKTHGRGGHKNEGRMLVPSGASINMGNLANGFRNCFLTCHRASMT